MTRRRSITDKIKIYFIALFLLILASSCKDDNNVRNYFLLYETRFVQDDNKWEYNVDDTSLVDFGEWFTGNPAYYKIENDKLFLNSSYYLCDVLSASATLDFADVNFDSYLSGKALIKIGVNSFYFSTSTDYPPNPNIEICLNYNKYSFSPDWQYWTYEDREIINSSSFVIEYFIKDYEIINVKINNKNIDYVTHRWDSLANNNFLKISCQSRDPMCETSGNCEISIDYVALYYK